MKVICKMNNIEATYAYHVSDLSEKIKRTLKSYWMDGYYKPINKLKNILVHPKDKTPDEEVCGGIFSIGCQNCAAAYIGATARPFKIRFNEHNKDVYKNAFSTVRTRSTRKSTSTTFNKSAITDHMNKFNHVPDWDSSKIKERATSVFDRRIRESIWIRRTKENMNRDEGAYQLPTVYTSSLLLSKVASPTIGGASQVNTKLKQVGPKPPLSH